jgi:hypothetical protein
VVVEDVFVANLGALGRHWQRLQRATINGTARVIPRDTDTFTQFGEAYLERFPDALPRFELGDFVLFELVPEDVRYVGGFARTARFTWAELMDEG